jgi:circadian clock protein KaiC
MSLPQKHFSNPAKARTGIVGFDEITQGGLPRGRATLLEGMPGTGKTIMALQSLVNGARHEREPGIFVAFEENTARLRANAAQFGWNLDGLKKDRLFFLDAQPAADVFEAGGFDLSGLLAVLDAKVRAMKARRIVLDSLDVVLVLLQDPLAMRREIYRLHDWLLLRGLTAIITHKIGGSGRGEAERPPLDFMQFMVDCALVLNHEIIQGVSHRHLRVLKYRGSGFAENEAPFLFSPDGMEVAGGRDDGLSKPPVTSERVSSGISRLDTMLGGGYFRASSVLVSGSPGTAKSTLGGAFAEAACRRGERTLFVSFDSDAGEMVRNLASVRIRLGRFVKDGTLRVVMARAMSGSAEIHLLQIKRLALEHRARCVVIDPVSALSKSGKPGTVQRVAERLIDWTKGAGITLLVTSLLDETSRTPESTPVQVSTIADTWIHLNYLVNAGERNRALTIVKSRGTEHSNQVRELILSGSGVTLTNVFIEGGEVLMGTLRWEREHANKAARRKAESAAKRQQAMLAGEAAELEGRLAALRHELAGKRAEQAMLTDLNSALACDETDKVAQMRVLRGADKT